MDARKVAIPLLAFAGGAVLGRVLGLRTLVRGATTAAAVTGIAPRAMLAPASARQTRIGGTRRRKAAQRSAQRKTAHKKTAPT